MIYELFAKVAALLQKAVHVFMYSLNATSTWDEKLCCTILGVGGGGHYFVHFVEISEILERLWRRGRLSDSRGRFS